MNFMRSDSRRPWTCSIRRRLTRSMLVTVLATICALAFMPNVLANLNATYCLDSTTGKTYLSHAGLNPSMPSPFWYAQIATANYTLEGIKGNISTAGSPYTFDNTHEHIDAYVGDREQSSAMRWIQTGWFIGEIEYCDGSIHPFSSINVYIEIFDDTSNSCTAGAITAAPSIASYDARYYAHVGSQYQYQIYFEVPGSGNIQDLGWGDYNSLTSRAIASGEAYATSATGDTPLCPVLGQTESGHWNYFGQQASQSTFAAELALYNNGSWSDWTSSVATTVTADAPYQIQSISNYTQFKNGGGQE